MVISCHCPLTFFLPRRVNLFFNSIVDYSKRPKSRVCAPARRHTLLSRHKRVCRKRRPTPCQTLPLATAGSLHSSHSSRARKTRADALKHSSLHRLEWPPYRRRHTGGRVYKTNPFKERNSHQLWSGRSWWLPMWELVRALAPHRRNNQLRSISQVLPRVRFIRLLIYSFCNQALASANSLNA